MNQFFESFVAEANLLHHPVRIHSLMNRLQVQSDIVYCESSNNYSKIILKDGSNFLISKTLKDVQEVLEEENFLRVHRQYIINLNHVRQLNRNEGVLTMVNGDHLPVARNQKERLFERYRSL